MGKIRNAAEKAWGATKRATSALILARTGEEPETGAGLRMLASLDEAVREARLLRRYYSRQVPQAPSMLRARRPRSKAPCRSRR